MSSFLPLFLSNYSLRGDFLVPGGKSAEYFGGVRYLWENSPNETLHQASSIPSQLMYELIGED